MTYFDTSYIAKCYLNEPQAARIRELARSRSDLTCCELGRVELASVLLRGRREGLLTRVKEKSIWRYFEEDEAGRVWHWLPITAGLIEQARNELMGLPDNLFLRAADALHLTCARAHGAAEIYSSDRHLLAAAPHFGLRPVNLLD